MAEGHLSWPPSWSPPIYSPLGRQSDPFEPQKPDHVIALFRTSTDFPSQSVKARNPFSASKTQSSQPPHPNSSQTSHLPTSSPPAPLSHAISLKQPGMLLPWTCALTVHSAWNVLLSVSHVNHTITPFSKALWASIWSSSPPQTQAHPRFILLYTLPDILYLLESSPERANSGEHECLCFVHTVAPASKQNNTQQVTDSHGEGDGTPLQYSCLENPMDGGAW